MEDISNFFEFFTKLLYGTHLSTAFSGLTFKQNKKEYCQLMLLVSVLLNLSCILLGKEGTIQIYPFLIHMPIVLYLLKVMNVSFFHSIFSVILAFQLLSCRAWIGGVFSYFTFNTPTSLNFFISLLTFPLAFLIGKYLAPPIAQLQNEPRLMLVVSIIPLTYYMFIMTIFIWEILAIANIEYILFLLDYIDIWFTLVFMIFIVISLNIFEEIKQADIENTVLLRMHNSAKTKLKQLHRQSEIERIHKHDLRHHGNYILSLLPENIDKNITEYIQSVMISPEDFHTLLSNNESLNLVLNFYKQQSQKLQINFEVQVGVEDYSGISMIDLCSLLSNGLENSINACKDLDVDKRKISLKIKTQGKILSIDLRNTFSATPLFVNDLPISVEEKHGYGTKSMLRICEKYNGITSFRVVNEEFRFQTIFQNGNNIISS